VNSFTVSDVPAIVVLVGLALGIFSAIAPLGPVTVLVVRRALAGESRGAMRVGMGRVPVESMYCMMATFGVVALLDRYAGARTAIDVLGTLVFLLIGAWLLIQGPTQPSAGDQPPQDARASRWGDWAGFIISLLNPSLLLSWSAGVGITVSMFGYAPTLFDKIAFPLALGLGIAVGYWILVAVLRRHGERIEHALVHRVIQAMGMVFVVLSVWHGAGLLGWV
jgi:threonine/homoserine/homoserine lactone efflux protein